MKCPQPLRNDLHRNAAFEAVFYWEKGMLKRLYKRFLEWALAPVLRPVSDGLGDLELHTKSIAGRVAALEVKTDLQ